MIPAPILDRLDGAPIYPGEDVDAAQDRLRSSLGNTPAADLALCLAAFAVDMRSLAPVRDHEDRAEYWDRILTDAYTWLDA